MAGKSLNRVQLIGNLGKDPEVKYTPQGTPNWGLEWKQAAAQKSESLRDHSDQEACAAADDVADQHAANEGLDEIPTKNWQ